MRMLNRRTLSLILTLLGVGGVGGTAFLAVKCNRKADGKETVKEKILAYAPAIVCGVGTSACILGSHHISRKEIMALTASCTYLAANRDKIEQKIREKFGDEKARQIIGEVAKERTPIEGEIIERTKGGNLKFMDFYSGRLFYSTYENVVEGIKKLNHDFHNGEYVCFNDLYRYWGIEETQLGYEFGWPANDVYYDWSLDMPIQFDIVKVDEDKPEGPLRIIYLTTDSPMQCWQEV